MKKKTLNSFFAILFFSLLVFYCITLILPFIWTFLTSLKQRLEYISSPFGLPKKWLFSNYIDVFEVLSVSINGVTEIKLPQLFFNSLSYSIISALILVFTNCVVAYVVVKYPGKVSSVLYTLVVVNMILPVVGTLAAELQIMDFLNFYDNMLGIFLMKIGFGGTNFLIFYATFKSVSWTYAEAAFVDGASHFKVFFAIMLPMAVPTFFALTLMQFITYWNDWQASLMYFPSTPTVAYALHTFQFPGAGAKVTGVPYIMAGCILVSMPIIIVFLIFRNKIMGSVSIGGLKG